MMSELYDLCDTLMDEIREVNKQEDISPTELDRVFKAIDIIKDIKTIEAMEGSYYYDEPRHSTGRRSKDGHGMHEEKEHMMKQIEQMKLKLENM